MAKQNQSILVQDVAVSITKQDDQDYICLTDMAKARTDSARAADVIKNWIRTRTTLEFLGTWEKIYNPNFKVVEFDHFKSEAGHSNDFPDQASEHPTAEHPQKPTKGRCKFITQHSAFANGASGQKETPGPLNRKRSRKGSRGQRLETNITCPAKSSMNPR